MPAVIAALGTIANAIILGYVALRAQSYKQLLEDIEEILDRIVERTAAATRSAVKRGMRDIVGQQPPEGDRRRWYDR